MAWNRRTVIDWSWRLSILLLPWQTRWFRPGPDLGGFPWEGGRLSFYGSWIPILTTVALAWLSRNKGKPRLSFRKRERTLLAGALFILAASTFSLWPIASVEMWVEVLILSALAWSLVELQIRFESLAAMFVVSLVPHILLGFWQAAYQAVLGSKWLGMAAQVPATPGVSVIEWSGVRILRAYGGFPHPNIFGGWLAVAIPLTIHLASRAVDRWRAAAWTVIGALSTAGLVFTFSRSAWLAAAVGFCIIGWCLFRHVPDARVRRYGLWALGSVLLTAVVFGALEHRFIFGRFDFQDRLEAKSLSERSVSFGEGIRLFKQYPLYGTGPGAASYALHSQTPPHVVPLLMLDELGLFGLFGFLLVSSVFFGSAVRRLKTDHALAWVRVTPFLMVAGISLFDHYPWSLWSGRALLALALILLSL